MRGVYRIKRKNGYSVFMTYSVDGKSYRHTVGFDPARHLHGAIYHGCFALHLALGRASQP